MVFGSFDVLHDGHRSLFRQAKRHGDWLIVVVARDDTYRSLRGQEPLHGEEERLRGVAEEELVDRAVLGDTKNQYLVLQRYRPDVVCLGYDQESFVDGLEGRLRSFRLDDTKVVRLDAYRPEDFKSSLLKKA